MLVSLTDYRRSIDSIENTLPLSRYESTSYPHPVSSCILGQALFSPAKRISVLYCRPVEARALKVVFMSGSQFRAATFSQIRCKLPYRSGTCFQFSILRGTSMKLVTVKLPEAILEGLDELVKAGMYQNRSAAIRAAVRDLLKRELWKSDAD